MVSACGIAKRNGLEKSTDRDKVASADREIVKEAYAGGRARLFWGFWGVFRCLTVLKTEVRAAHSFTLQSLPIQPTMCRSSNLHETTADRVESVQSKPSQAGFAP